MTCVFCLNRIGDKADYCYFCGESTTISDHATPIQTDLFQNVPLLPQIGAELPPDAPEEYKYVIEDIAGWGGMGVVYRARRKLLRDIVAIKVLKPRLASNKGWIHRFLKEARTTALLRHKNILHIHYLNEGGKRVLPFFAMEFLRGQSLRDLLVDKEAKKRNKLELKRALDLMEEICTGVGHAHRFEQKIVHRDLKPDNIWVLPFNPDVDDKESIKILDFGIVKVREEEEQSQWHTGTGAIMGTDRYMSPEQCLGIELDVRSDVYSLGVIFYEMLAGRTPFIVKSQESYRTQHLRAQPPPFADDLNIPLEIEKVVMRTLAKEPDERPADALVLRGELRKAYRRYLERLKEERKQVDDDWERRDTVVQVRQRREKISNLKQEIAQAKELEDWGKVSKKLTELLKLDPSQVVKAELDQARQQEQLSALYNEAQKFYGAGQLSEALEILEQILKQDKNYKDVASLLLTLSEELADQKINTLYSEAQALLDEKNWEALIDKLKELLILDPYHTGAQALLNYAQNQKNLEELYLEAQANYEAGKWKEALSIFRQIYNAEDAYKDVASLIQELEGKIKQEQIDSHFRRAQVEIGKELWEAAVEPLQAILKLEPKHIEAAAKLDFVERQRHAAKIYGEGKQFQSSRQWAKALDSFRQVEAIVPAYKDVSGRISEIQSKLEKEKAERLYTVAEKALAEERWSDAIANLQKLLKLNPAHQEGNAKLTFAGRQQDLANLYSAALNHLTGGRLEEALKEFQRAQEIDRKYKDVRGKITEVQRMLKQKRIADLLNKASALASKKDWAAATKAVNEILTFEPNHIGALKTLSEIARIEKESLEKERKAQLERLRIQAEEKRREEENAKKRLRRRVAVAGVLVLTAITVISYYYPPISYLTGPTTKTTPTGSTDKPQIVHQLNRDWNFPDPKILSSGSTNPERAIPVVSIALSPDGSRLVSVNKENALLWNTKTKERLRILPASPKDTSVYGVAFSPDGKIIATTSEDEDGTINLWEAGSGDWKRPVLIRRKKPNSDLGSVLAISLAFSPDSKLLVAGCDDGTVEIWDLDENTSTVLNGDGSLVHCVAFSPDQQMLAASTGNGAILIWKLQGIESSEGSKQPEKLADHEAVYHEAVYSVAFSYDSKTLASGSGDKKVILWNVEKWNVENTPPTVLHTLPHKQEVMSVAFSPNNTLLVTGGTDGQVRLWDLSNKGVDPWRVSPTYKDVLSIAYSANGKVLSVGYADGSLRVWDMSDVEQ